MIMAMVLKKYNQDGGTLVPPQCTRKLIGQMDWISPTQKASSPRAPCSANKRKHDSSEVVSVLSLPRGLQNKSRKYKRTANFKETFFSLFCSAFIGRFAITTSALQ